MKYIKVRLQKNQQEALVNIEEIAVLISPDRSPSDPKLPPKATWFVLLLKSGSALECMDSRDLIELAERLEKSE